MRLVAPEVIGVPGAQSLGLLADGDLQPAAQDQAALLAFVSDLVLTRSRARLVALLDELNRAIVQIGADLQV